MNSLESIQEGAHLLLYGSQREAIRAAIDLFGTSEFEKGLLYRDFTEQKFRSIIYDFYPLTRLLIEGRNTSTSWHELVSLHVDVNRSRGKDSLFRLAELFSSFITLAGDTMGFSRYEWLNTCLAAGISSEHIFDGQIGWIQSEFDLPSMFDFLNSHVRGEGDLKARIQNSTYHQDETLFDDIYMKNSLNPAKVDLDKYKLPQVFLFVVFRSTLTSRPMTIRMSREAETSLLEWITSGKLVSSLWYDFFRSKGLRL